MAAEIKTITKKELCNLLGLYHPNGRPDYRALNRDYFTPDALKLLNIKPESFKFQKKFDIPTTQRILDHFNLRPYKPGR